MPSPLVTKCSVYIEYRQDALFVEREQHYINAVNMPNDNELVFLLLWEPHMLDERYADVIFFAFFSDTVLC